MKKHENAKEVSTKTGCDLLLISVRRGCRIKVLSFKSSLILAKTVICFLAFMALQECLWGYSVHSAACAVPFISFFFPLVLDIAGHRFV